MSRLIAMAKWLEQQTHNQELVMTTSWFYVVDSICIRIHSNKLDNSAIKKLVTFANSL